MKKIILYFVLVLIAFFTYIYFSKSIKNTAVNIGIEENIIDGVLPNQVADKKLNYGYKIEDGKVYYKYSEIIGADISSFHTIGEYNYSLAPAEDKNFYYEKGEVVAHTGDGFYKSYNDKYFKRGPEVYGYYNWYFDVHIGPIISADPDTFLPLTDFYSRDSDSLFYFENKVEGADPASFIIVDLPYTKDKNSVYIDGIKIEGANPNSFSVVRPASNIRNIYYGKDDSGVFYESILQDADPNTFYIKNFQITSKQNLYFGADSDGLYNYGKLLVGIDPNHAYIENNGGIVRDQDTKWYRKKTGCEEPGNTYIPESEIPEAERVGWVGGTC